MTPPDPSSTGKTPHDGGYDLAGPDPDDLVAEAAPVPPIPPRARPATPRPAPDEPRPAARRSTLDDGPAVEQVWSRWAESGGSLVKLALVAIASLFAFITLLQAGWMGTAFLAMVLGGLACLALAYPLMITLERPVRVTPERGVRDYFEALSHHRPHFLRMWLLLSRRGRAGGRFASFEGFRAYWDERLSLIRARAGASRWTPLQFEVQGFKSNKGQGDVKVDATYTVEVYLRGKRADGPVETVRVKAGLVQGPDRMWYLEDGTLPFNGGPDPETEAA